MLSDIETVPSAKICQDVISLKKGVLKIPVVTHIDTHTHTQRALVKHWIAHRKWLFGNLTAPPMAHRALSLSSRLQSVSFYLSHSSSSSSSLPASLQFPSPSPVHGRGCLPTLGSWTCAPSLLSSQHVSKLHWDYIEAWLQRMKFGILNVVSWGVFFCFFSSFVRLCWLVQRPESHLVSGFKWNAAKLGQSPSLRSSCSLRQGCRLGQCFNTERLQLVLCF